MTADPGLSALEAALGAQYDVMRPLGRGGMGTVYLARERLLDRLVAIKMLHPERIDAESHERFLREARAAARLTHPNIVPLYSFGQSDGTVFYVMGYVDGESLESLLRRTPRLPATEVARILRELSGALDYAHQHGVVHRDVKPDNILIEHGTGRAVLTDFGIARVTTGSALTRTGVIIGTPQYMSPEQAAGDREVDGRSDLYSLGLVGYRMLTGRLPFESSSVQEALAQHMTKRPVPVMSLATDASPALAAAVMRCLEKNPDDRWPTGAALDRALGENSGAELSLPDGLEHHASRGVKAIAFAYGFGLLFEMVYGISHDAWWLKFGAVASGLTSLALVPSFVEAKLAGLSIRQSVRAFFAAPAKWAGWWPRALRRPGDVWDRLPQPIRRGRNLMLGSSTVVLTISPIFIFLLTAGLRNPGSYLRALGVAAAANALGLLGMGFGAGIIQRFAKEHRLPGAAMRRRLIQEPVWGSSFWSRPEIAPLLAPALPAQQVDAPSSFAALSAAVADLARDLEPLDRHLAADVRETARDLGEIIAGFDREIAELATHLDPAESERLEARMRALGEARHDDAGTTSRMRDLIASQLALLEDLRQRQATLEERRAQAIERLRTLWLHLAGLRARRVLEDADAAEITGRIRALCSDVEYLNTAIDELNALTPN